MNNWTPLAPLLSLIGACLGAILGFGLFRAGQYNDFATAVTSMSVLGASIGFVVGASFRKRAMGVILKTFSGFALSALMLCGAIVFVLFGILRHSSFLIYNGLIFAVASFLPLVRNTSPVLTALMFAAVGVISFGVFVVSGDRSWLIVSVPSALAACLTYVNRHHKTVAS